MVGAVVVVALTSAVAIRLGALERQGPARIELSIGDGIPATLYLPYEADEEGEAPYPPPPGERPPVVVVAHGYSADQAIMSPMARSLAEAGYAALTFDFRGHGSNLDSFAGDLTDDLDAVVDHLERSPFVDAERIVVLGHSMGASAVLDFATLDDRPIAVVPVSGGFQVHDAVVPDHVLLMVASGDPERIHERQAEITADLGRRTDVVEREISGTDHITILFSNTAIEEIVSFLDPIAGLERSGQTPGLDDDRLAPGALYLVLAVITIGLIGSVAGRFVEPDESGAGAGGLLLVAAALVATYPVMAVGGFSVLPIGAGQPIVVQLLLASGLLWGLKAMVGRGMLTGRIVGWLDTGPWLPLRRVAAPGVLAALAVVLLFLPLGAIVHRLVPTPTRLLLWIVVSLMALPFFSAFEALVRRGGTWGAIGWGLLGRIVLLIVLAVGLGLGLLPPVIALVVPLLIGQYVLLEIFAATAYASGRNPALIAVTESVLIGWIVVTLTPIG